MEIQFVQHPGRPPTGNIVDSTFRAPQRGSDPVLGEVRLKFDEGTEGFSGPSRRSGPTIHVSGGRLLAERTGTAAACGL